MLQLPLNVQLDDSAKYENFFVGNNQQLISRLKSLTSLPDSDFIFVWGAAESGKTHLAQALCNSLDHLETTAIYLPLNNQTLTSDILVGMNTLDFICLDDFDHIIGLTDWEQQLFNLYNHLKAENKSLVIFSQQSPTNSLVQLKDLKSRLTAMEIYKIESLDELQKQGFLQQRALIRGLKINDEVAKFILTRKSRSMTDLMHVIDQLDKSSLALQRKITIPLVKEIFDL